MPQAIRFCWGLVGNGPLIVDMMSAVRWDCLLLGVGARARVRA